MAGEKRREGIEEGGRDKRRQNKRKDGRRRGIKKRRKMLKNNKVTSRKRKPWVLGLEDSGLSVSEPPEYDQCNLTIANYTAEHTVFCSTSNTPTS